MCVSIEKGEKEIEAFSALMENPERPLLMIVAGSKMETKMNRKFPMQNTTGFTENYSNWKAGIPI